MGAVLSHFHPRDGALHCEDVPLLDLARDFGTPLYVYSAAAMRAAFAEVRSAFGPDAFICYAVKANPNLSLLRLFAALGAGFDLVSGGELQRLQAAGIAAQNAVFAGAAKAAWEIDAAADAGVRTFHLESPHEVDLLAAAGRRLGRRLAVSLRLNPDVDAGTHRYITTGRGDTKFGVELPQAAALVRRIAQESWLRLCGYHVHLGSQLRTAVPYLEAFDRVAAFLDADPAHRDGIEHYDFGGGFAIAEGTAPRLELTALARQLLPRLEARGLSPVLEPGRFLVGDAGALLTTVLGQKQTGRTQFLLVDAAMNDLIRPTLYQAEHPMRPVLETGRPERLVDVVGPVCENGDFLARGRLLPELRPGELLAVLAAGAYGAAMASTYNSRRRPAEVLVDGRAVRLIRRRESFAALWADEVDLP